MTSRSKAQAAGWSLSSIAAALLSLALNQSLGWALVHFVFGWLYLLYAAIFRSHDAAEAIARMFGT